VAQNYTRTALGLHWIVALLIFATFGLKYISYHKWLGVTVFIFAVLRVVWRLTHAAPALEESLSRFEKFAANAVHHVLYVLIFAVPLSGYFYSLAAGFPVVYLGVLPLPVFIEPNVALADTLKSLHQVLVYTMAGIVGLHVAGALKHYLIDHDGTLARMLPFLKRSDS
jgi:cytochrome b561